MKITLCGSTRFRRQYDALNFGLSTQGHVVYSVSACKKERELDADDKETLDLVHLYKILESDAVLVIDCDTSVTNGDVYIGQSTTREIKWAKLLNKDVWYLSEVFSDVDEVGIEPAV